MPTSSSILTSRSRQRRPSSSEFLVKERRPDNFATATISRELPLPETFFVPTDRDQGTRVSDDLPFGSRGGLSFRYYFPVDAEYTFKIKIPGSDAGSLDA